MRNLILGAILGGLAVKFYQSQQGQELVRGQLANTASNTGKMADIIDAAPVPTNMKDQADQATAALRSVARSAQQRSTRDTTPATTSTTAVATTLTSIPDDVLADEDAATRAANEARHEQEIGA
jgi:hypothetical protein